MQFCTNRIILSISIAALTVKAIISFRLQQVIDIFRNSNVTIMVADALNGNGHRIINSHYLLDYKVRLLVSYQTL